MFTESFIEKVIKAGEIQRLWETKNGDWFVCKRGDTIIIGLGSQDYEKLCIDTQIDYPWYFDDFYAKNAYWLPTFEDLFGIWENREVHANIDEKIVNHIYYFLRELIAYQVQKMVGINIVDLKELALHFVMFRGFNKSWNPDKGEWEENNDN